MVAYWSCAALLIRGDLPTLLECAKCEYRRIGDASPFSRSLYLLVGGVLKRTPLTKVSAHTVHLPCNSSATLEIHSVRRYQFHLCFCSRNHRRPVSLRASLDRQVRLTCSAARSIEA